jgi:hypothetical protein
MTSDSARIAPSETVLTATRQWLAPVRAALDDAFLSACLTGSVLTQGFDPRRQRVNLLVVARTLDLPVLDRLAVAIPVRREPPLFDPLFLTRDQVHASLDVFPVEFLEMQEAHLLLEGEDVLGALTVPRTHLRHQCEHELRGRHLRLRQAYLAAHGDSRALHEALTGMASSFHTQFRTLLRLQGEPLPASLERVIARVAEAYGLHAPGLLAAHLMKQAEGRPSGDEVRARARAFLTEVERLVAAIDRLSVR